MLLVHGGDDGVGAAHRLISHGDWLAGLDIRQAVVVDYLQYLHLVQAGDGLGRLVVVHQNHLLAPGPEQMETGQGAHHFFVFVQNRVAAVTAGEQGLLNVVQVVAEMEGDYALGMAQAHHRHRLVYEPGGLAGVQGGGDDAGVAGAVFQLRGYLRLADYQTGDLGLQRRLYHLRLVAADEYAVGGEHGPVGKALGHGYLDLAGDGVGGLGKFVYQIPLQHADKVEEGQLVHTVFVDSAQVIGGHVTGGENAVKGAVIVEDGDGGHLPVPHGLPGQLQRHGTVQLRGVVKIQVADLGAHVLYVFGGFKTKTLEHVESLVIH